MVISFYTPADESTDSKYARHSALAIYYFRAQYGNINLHVFKHNKNNGQNVKVPFAFVSIISGKRSYGFV